LVSPSTSSDEVPPGDLSPGDSSPGDALPDDDLPGDVLTEELPEPEPAEAAEPEAAEPVRQGPDRIDRLIRLVFPAGIAVSVALFLYGGWERRWIADDGLIVLRTVRNLMAGNGPVFNAGERVETNTSVLWTYLNWGLTWASGARPEYAVLALTLVLSGLSILFALLGAGLLWRVRGGKLLLPAGVLVYIALPPARDYATSGLETSLIICWLGLMWWLLLRWMRNNPLPANGAELRPMLLPAFVAGLGPLVRPELAVMSALILGYLVWLPIKRPIRSIAVLAAVAGFVPVVYQIFRMGYYALPYPNTALAKDAAGAKWEQGLKYMSNLFDPYWLWIPFAVLVVAALANIRIKRPDPEGPHHRFERRKVVTDRSLLRLFKKFRSATYSPGAIVAIFVVSGLLLFVYVLRVGGDFMHGRVFLPALFALILPVAALPVRVRGHANSPLRFPRAAAAITGVAWLFIVVWAGVCATIPGMPGGTVIGKTGIVDERAFYVLNTGRDHPILAEDYMDFPRVRAMVRTLEERPDGGMLLATMSFLNWAVAPPPQPIPEGGAQQVVYFLNLGMSSMNVGLDVKVIDQMGLAYPLAAHSQRLEDGRIGHDKSLPPDWAVVDTGMVTKRPWMPPMMDERWVSEAQVAINCPETQAVLNSTRGELTLRRFLSNVIHSIDFARYRIDRIPEYELIRCKLQLPQ
jgi:arabinofuranosyltransferase